MKVILIDKVSNLAKKKIYIIQPYEIDLKKTKTK